MYFCRTCNKYVKEGNVCDSCGKKLSPQEGIVFCPKCNKSFFFPGINKKFTCQGCGTVIVVDEKFLKGQKGKTEINLVNDNDTKYEQKTSTNNNLQINGETGNNIKEERVVNDEQKQSSISYNQVEKFTHNNSNFNTASNSVGAGIGSTGENKIQEEKKKEIKKDIDGIDESLFEDATSSDVKEEVNSSRNSKDKKKKEKHAKDTDGEDKVKSSNGGATKILSLISVALMFVLIVGAIFYIFILPLIIPSYKTNWDRYISSQNTLNQSQGINDRTNTISFDVESETKQEVVAIVKVEEKIYDEATKTYTNSIITYRVTFVNKKGSFVVATLEDITE